MNEVESVQDYAKRLGRFRAQLKHQILAYLEEAQASFHPDYYLNHLGHAVFITWHMLDSTKHVGTKAEYQEMANALVDLWCKPINLDMLTEISATLQWARERRMARLVGQAPHQEEDQG